ncbi:MAG: glycosyltransferase [Patescibacteria group bacterium]
MSNNSGKRILCLSFWTPPVVRPQSILIGKMIPEWMKQGLEPFIVAYEQCGEWQIDVPIFRIPIFSTNRYFNHISFLREVLKYRYYRKMAKKIEKFAIDNKVEFIFSFSKPMDSNIIGAMLKKRLKLPFVSHFSDPWFDDPYKSLSKSSAKYIYFQEKFIIENSERVLFTNSVAENLIMKKFPESWKKKADVIPHNYNLADYPEVEKPDSGKFVISYIGAFYKKRNPELLFKALSSVVSKHPELKSKFGVKLIGAANDYAGYSTESIEKIADIYSLRNNIEIIPPVSYEESLKYMKLSDCLVVIDADIPDSPFLPSKVVDYAGSGNVILGITPANSPTAKFIEDLGCKSFSYNQFDKLSEYLEKLISGEKKIDINKEVLNKYSVKNTTAKLIEIFQQVINAKIK